MSLPLFRYQNRVGRQIEMTTVPRSTATVLLVSVSNLVNMEHLQYSDILSTY